MNNPNIYIPKNKSPEVVHITTAEQLVEVFGQPTFECETPYGDPLKGEFTFDKVEGIDPYGKQCENYSWLNVTTKVSQSVASDLLAWAKVYREPEKRHPMLDYKQKGILQEGDEVSYIFGCAPVMILMEPFENEQEEIPVTIKFDWRQTWPITQPQLPAVTHVTS